MSSNATRRLSDRDRLENPSDPLLITRTKEQNRFFKTRSAILSGKPLYKYRANEIRTQGLMGPWSFKAAQSILDSIPGIIVSAVITILWSKELAVANLGDPLQTKIASVLSPLKPPLTLSAVVFIISYACLPSEYVTKQNWRAAQRKYLYADGAYGLWPQLILAWCVAIFSIPSSALPNDGTGIVMTFLDIVFALTVLWQLIITGSQIKGDLFEYDYVQSGRPMFSYSYPPRIRFFAVTGFALLLIILLLNLLIDGAAAGAATILHRLAGG